ncbi:MAG: hypothetical protein DRI32_00395 [Chloroflexi bacterium]|nr:MAG: hypothetical protein DRI32_00395 [Chloroflexota bacterium]
MEWNIFFDLLKDAGPAGMIVGVLVLLFVYAGEFTDVFQSGNLKRWAAVGAATLFAGVEPGNAEAAITGALGLLIATGFKMAIDALMHLYIENKKK